MVVPTLSSFTDCHYDDDDDDVVNLTSASGVADFTLALVTDDTFNMKECEKIYKYWNRA